LLDYLNGGNIKPSPDDNAVEAGLKMTITFAPQSATVNAVDWGSERAQCPEGTGLFGRYTKDRK